MSATITTSRDGVQVGDLIGYPATDRSRGQRAEPSLLRVVRIEPKGLIVHRENPEPWAEGVEFVVFDLQLRENGVLIYDEGEAQP